MLPNNFGDGVTCFNTKGDANKDEDGFLLDESRVIGIVKFHIPKLGYVVRFIQLKWYLVLPLFVVFILFLHLIKLYIEDDGDGEKAETAGVGSEKPAENKENAEKPDTGEASEGNAAENAGSLTGAESEK